MKLRVGLSTCPNDTFAFHALLERRIDLRGLEIEATLLDVQQLNDGLFAGDFDVSKASFHAALLLSDRYRVLAAGSALGFGVGPLLVAARPARRRRRGRGCSARAPPPPPPCSTTACTRTRAPSIRQCSRTSGGAAQGRRRSGRAHPRGPAHLPARRPAAGRGHGHLVRAAGRRADSAGRDPGRAGAARWCGRDLQRAVARVDRLWLGASGRGADHDPPPRPGAGRGRDLALRGAVRERPHGRPGRRGRRSLEVLEHTARAQAWCRRASPRFQ